MNSQKYTFMKKVLTLMLLLAGWRAFAQPAPYNNEWIKFNQTYYKFKVGQTGLYRIPRSLLDAMGIGNTSVQFFELWRNGERVQFSAPVASGPLPGNGYLEFWAKANDGVPDKVIYRDPTFQHTDKLSLFSDSAVFFLSVNTTAQGGALVANRTNNVAGNVLPPEPYCLYKAGVYFNDQINYGFAVNVGEYVYSSSYDKGEYWSSPPISPATGLSRTVNGLFPYTGVPNATLSFGASGNAVNPRNVKVRVNSTEVKDTIMNYFNDLRTNVLIPVSLISSGNASVDFINTSGNGGDQMVVSFFEFNYARQFNFGGQKNFQFRLPARAAGYYLEITNFNAGSTPPVLYDLTDTARYVGDMSVPGMVRFALPGSPRELSCVLVNEEAANITNVASLTPKNFTNFAIGANQGNFLIISNPILYTGTHNNNPVDEYRQYRTSAAGGGYVAKVVDVYELMDQFAFGIWKHPLSIRNFIRYARDKFGMKVEGVFLLGRGMDYTEYYYAKGQPKLEELSLVPTFGSPSSDNLLAANDLTVPVANTPIGRLSAVTATEVENYLEKIKEYESAQANSPHTIDGRAWMKTVVHVTGSSDPYLGTVLCNYMDVYRRVIEQPQFGAQVSTFCKTSTDPVEQLSDVRIHDLFTNGISVLNYFGHSSAVTLGFNLDDPDSYKNKGKYPVMFVNGCNAGNFFTYNSGRFASNETLSEKYVLAKQSGSISFVASTHFGIVNYLNLFLTNLYSVMSGADYGKGLGLVVSDAMQGMVNSAGPYDFYARAHAEEITVHGDPVLKINYSDKADYVVEPQLINVNPAFISVSQSSFQLKVKVVNIGKATTDSVMLEVKRKYPDGSTGIIYRAKMRAIPYADSITFNLPIVSTRDKGANSIVVTADPDQQLDEVTRNNNSASKDIFIYEDEARPVYPYNFAIVSDASQKLYASTANPLSPQKNYVMEIDTTELFNSSLKVTKTVTSSGGILEFTPGINFVDSMVYYWRVSMVPAVSTDPYNWNEFSFMYLNNSKDGANQSHYFQHRNSSLSRMSYDADRKWRYAPRSNELSTQNTVYPTGSNQQSAFVCSVNDQYFLGPGCTYDEIIFNVLDGTTFKPWMNDFTGPTGRYQSLLSNCGSQREFNFDYMLTNNVSRKKAMDFMDSIPNGSYVLVRGNVSPDSTGNTYADHWKADTSFYGSGNSLYHKMVNAGFIGLDSFNRPRSFLFIYKKGDPSFNGGFRFSTSIYDRIFLTVNCPTPDTLGFINSPKFGPATQWQKVSWRGTSQETPMVDNPRVNVIGIDTNGVETQLYALDKNTQDFDISAVNARQFPYMRLVMRNADSIKLTPYQLNYWRIFYVPPPEGAIAPNLAFAAKDTLEVGETFDVKVAFKNVGKIPFPDSLKVKMVIVDKNNVSHAIPQSKYKPLIVGDTIMVRTTLTTTDYTKLNNLQITVNPDNDQPEQYTFNNFLYHDFYVRSDDVKPVMDVTFDGVHILNRDVVSSRPHVEIRLKDEAKYLLLNDTALISVQVRNPDGSLSSYKFNTDTLQFRPATSSSDNTAVIDFNPAFLRQISADGDEYELIVMGRDKSGNKAGEIGYHVTFRVFTKPMISNLLNYPNPFTTSTAFVFTITGYEVPQNIKIQILTVTGKIVREITKEELGPVHIGRNITDFKWNGTDQYGQRLANGVYLYRVVTTLNGKSMEKYKAEGDNTDRFFTNGYGKMYLMK